MSSRVAWVPHLGVAVVVLCDLGGVPSDSVATMALNAFVGMPLETQSYVPQPFEISADDVREFLGGYASDEPYGRLRLFLDARGELRAAAGEMAQEVATTACAC